MSPAVGSKRKGGPQKQQQDSKQPRQQGQKAVSRDIEVAIDEGFEEKGIRDSMTLFVSDLWPTGDFEIYIDDDDLIHDASLNQTNVGNNNNKVSCSICHSLSSLTF